MVQRTDSPLRLLTKNNDAAERSPSESESSSLHADKSFEVLGVELQ